MAEMVPGTPSGLVSQDVAHAGQTAPTIGAAPAPLPQATTPVDQGETGTPFGPTTGIPHPIPIPQKTADWESGYQNEHGPRPSRWDAWVAAPFQEGAHGTVSSPWGGAMMRLMQEQDSHLGTMIGPEQANKLYPGRPVPYTTPVDQGVAQMEYFDRQKQQEMADWAAQRPQTTMGKVVSTASGFVGGLTDPLNFAIGALSGGVAEVLTPEAAGIAGKVAAHYAANLGGFSVTDALQNMVEHRMGAKQKQIPEIIGENVVPAAVMTGIGVGLSALARNFADRGGGTSEADAPAIKKTIAAMEDDRRPPGAPPGSPIAGLLEDRRGGVSVDPNGNKIRPTVMTSPIHETPLYAATHSDGTPLIHEHGLGSGAQLTDSHDVANNGVSRSTETPGQIGETKLPEGTKLLDIEQTGVEDSNKPDSFLKKIEEKTGIDLSSAMKSGESLKEVIKNLGDFSGISDIPEDVLSQVQDVAKSMGYHGYLFDGENSRQVHLFDPSGLEISKQYSADPATTPTLPDTESDIKGTQPAQQENPAVDKADSKFYSPEIEKLAHEFRKGKTFDPYSPEATAELEKDVEAHKQQLADLAKTSDTAREALEELRKQEAKDARLRDIAKRIAECGDGGGL